MAEPGWPCPAESITAYAGKFLGKYAHRVVKGGIGHNLAQEAPQAFADVIVALDGYAIGGR